MIAIVLDQGLEGLGLGPGSVLCLWCSNHPHFWLLCLAAWECGAATLAVNCLIPGERLEEQLREVDAKLLVCDALNFEEGLEVKNRGGVAQVVVIGIEEGGASGATRVEELLANEKAVRGSACHAWDWDTSALSLSYTSRDGRSRVVQHTNSLASTSFSCSSSLSPGIRQLTARVAAPHSQAARQRSQKWGWFEHQRQSTDPGPRPRPSRP